MADTGMGHIYRGIVLFIGCLNQIAQSAVLQEVHVVPSHGQPPGGQQPQYPPQYTGQYPPPHPVYPGGFQQEAHPPYTIPGQQAAADPQYQGQNPQGTFSPHAYPQHTLEAQNFHHQAAGQLTPGQNPSGSASPYQDQFTGQAQGAYPPQGTQGAYLPQGTQGAYPQQGTQGAYPQQGPQGYPDPADPAQAQATYPGATPPGYPQGQSQAAYAAPQHGSLYPYHGSSHLHTGSYPPPGYPGQSPAGFPNPQGAAFPDPNAHSPGGAAPHVGGAMPDTGPAYHDQASANAQATVPATAASPTASQSGGQQGTDPQQAQLAQSPPGAPPAAASGGPAPSGNVPYSGPQAGDTATQPQAHAGPPSAEYPMGNVIPTQGGANMLPYKYQDKKPQVFAQAAAAANAQSKVVVGSQPGFPPPQGQSLAGNVVSYPNHPAGASPHHAPHVLYPGQMAPGASAVHHAYPPRGYPYPGPGPYPGHRPTHNAAPYAGHVAHGHAPYPGHSQVPYQDPHSRTYPGGTQGNSAQPSKHGPSQRQRFPNNNARPPPPTTTITPETTPEATPFPPELRCLAQSECELGCCYASDGSILWDHLKNYGKEGYCYTKTTTLPGEGCHPMVCPCQADQFCISVPSENATIPTLVGEVAEGAMSGSPKCYSHDQQMQIHEWLKKLETIVISCRFDGNCPIRAMHRK